MKIYVNSRDFKVFFVVTFKYKRFYVYTGLQTTEKFSGMIFPKSDRSAKAKTARLASLYTQVENYVLSHQNEAVEELKGHIHEIVTGAKKTSVRPLVEYILLSSISVSSHRQRGSTTPEGTTSVWRAQ